MELDHELEDVLRQLFEACDEFQITPRLIGGLAVRGHTKRKRYTHGIDLSVGREDKANLIAILKSMGFEYRDQTAFGGVKAWQQIGKVPVELHISVDRLWDMRSERHYVLSPVVVRVTVDEQGEILTLAVPVEDLLILKLLPLRDQDLADVIELLLDKPELNVNVFWENCQRTDNTDHILRRLSKVEQVLKDGTFRRAWRGYYTEDISPVETLVVTRAVELLKKAKL